MPEAEKRKTDPNAGYGEQTDQAEFMAATSPVATPETPQNVPQIAPQAFQAEPVPFTPPGDIAVPGRELDPEEASILFGGGTQAAGELDQVDVSWLPAFAELADDPDVPEELRALGRVAIRMIEEQDAAN